MAHLLTHKDENNNLIYEIDKKAKKGKYYLIKADKQTEFLENPIFIDGFDKLPSGFYKDGFGLTTAGNFIVQEIFNKYNKKIQLTVTSKTVGKIDARGKFVSFILPHSQLSKLGQTVTTIKRERNAEIRSEIKNALGQNYTQFKEFKDYEAGYIPGKLSEILDSDKVLKNLSNEDREALETFIPSYLENIPGTLKAKKKLKSDI